jgi:hypothetical protein
MKRCNLIHQLVTAFGIVALAWAAGASAAFSQGYDAGGSWNSDWGPVNLSLAGPQADQTYNITGSWAQSGRSGQITRGNYDPASGRMWFSYYQPWNNQRGTAKFNMNSNGTKLRGTWKQGSGSGSWILSRSSAPMLCGPPPGYGTHAAAAPITPVATRTANLSGVWNSEWGPVTLRHGAPQMDGSTIVSGSWVQGPGQVGLIQQGRVVGNVMMFKYSMPWVATTGSAKLTLSPDRRRLSGVWTQKGGSGTWTLTR